LELQNIGLLRLLGEIETFVEEEIDNFLSQSFSMNQTMRDHVMSYRNLAKRGRRLQSTWMITGM